MTSFEEWIEAEHAAGNNHTEYASALLGWDAGQAAERERIKQIVRDVTEGRSNCNLLLERIGE